MNALSPVQFLNSPMSRSLLPDGKPDDPRFDTSGWTSLPLVQDMALSGATSYEILAWTKRYTSRFAAHLSAAHRQRLFAQLDRLHDEDEWEEGDQPMRWDSFITFLNAIIVLKPTRWPSLGMTHDGYLLASWGGAVDHVSAQFRADDEVRWSLTQEQAGGKLVHAAGLNSALELRHFLAPYGPDHWFRAG